MSHGNGVANNSKEVRNGKNGNNGHSTKGPDTPTGSVSIAPPPDGGWGWVVVFASFMVHIITDGMTYSFGVFYTEFLDYFKESKSKTAWIVSILVGVTLSSGPISSSFVNRWGCQAVTVAGSILAAVCVILSSFAQNVWTLIFTIGVGTGFGFGLIYLPAIVSVTVWFERKRSLATGIAVCGSGLGTFLFAPITSMLITSYGWRGAMGIIGGIVLNCVPLGIMFRPVPEVPIRRTSVTEPMLVPKNNKVPLIRSQSTENVTARSQSIDNRKVEDNDVGRLTLSQPALNKHEHKTHQTQIHSRHGSGIMMKPDVLYTGSKLSLSRRRSATPETTTRWHTRRDTEHSSAFKAALSQMLDVSLLVDPIFILFALSNFLTSIGFYVPYVYTVPLAEHMGLKNPEYLISIIGAANLVGRIALGYISDQPWVNRLVAYNTCLTIAGIATALAMVCWEFWGLAAYATVFGFTIGAYVGLTSVVLVDLLGLEKLTNAFGLLLLFQGIASLIGPPFAGWLYDATASYAPGFYVAGGAIALSGIILFAVPFLEKWSNKREYQETPLEQI